MEQEKLEAVKKRLENWVNEYARVDARRSNVRDRWNIKRGDPHLPQKARHVLATRKKRFRKCIRRIKQIQELIESQQGV